MASQEEDEARLERMFGKKQRSLESFDNQIVKYYEKYGQTDFLIDYAHRLRVAKRSGEIKTHDQIMGKQ